METAFCSSNNRVRTAIRRAQRAPGAVPSGRALPDESIIAALYREVREETGLRVTAVGRLAWAVEVRSQGQPDIVTLVYEAEVGAGEPVPEDPDGFILAARFVDVEEAIEKIGSTVPWRSMREPLVAYMRCTAEPGTNWFYRADGGDIELLELVLPPDAER